MVGLFLGSLHDKALMARNYYQEITCAPARDELGKASMGLNERFIDRPMQKQ
jgi:hypothetical protein